MQDEKFFQTQLSADVLARLVLPWFEIYGRKTLPWQQDPSAYRVWVSEVMLQQTQVNTVLQYFQRFMAVFPSMNALAQAKLDQVLQLWAGLGYYARGRNLHKTAQRVMQDFQGELPVEDFSALLSLPGIGRSTAGAIISLSHHGRAPILDGNVKRILCRLHALPNWPGHPETLKTLWHLAEYYTPYESVAAYTQAMMDIGATVCARRPHCAICPFTEICLAYQRNQQNVLPVAKPLKIRPKRAIYVCVLSKPEKGIYLEQRPFEGLWGGLWSLPQFESFERLEAWVNAHQMSAKAKPILSPFKHQLTHFELTFHSFEVNALKIPETLASDNHWIPLGSLEDKALPVPIKKILMHYQNQTETQA